MAPEPKKVPLCQFLYFFNHFLNIRKSASFFFRIEQLSIYHDFKYTTTAWNQSHFCDIVTKMAKYLFREPRGFWCVVSHHAKFNKDFISHASTLLLCKRHFFGLLYRCFVLYFSTIPFSSQRLDLSLKGGKINDRF
jgi:hypothetical protein